MHAYNYVAQKHSESASALVKAGSLPYENFIEKDGPRVPSLTPIPEAQLSDVIIQDIIPGAQLGGYMEVIPDLNGGLYYNAEPPSTNYTKMSGEAAVTVTADATPTLAESYAETPDGFKTLTHNEAMNIGPTGVHSGTFYVSKLQRSQNVEISVSFRVWNGAAFASAGTVTIPGGSASGSVVVNFPNAAEYTQITAVCNDIPFLPNRITFDWGITMSSGALNYRNPGTMQSNILFRQQWPYFKDLPPVELQRTIACDAMLTYMGSNLINGGEIAAAVVPYDYTLAGLGSAYDIVAKLRNNRMDGPMKDGAHLTWRPFTTRDLVMHNPESQRHAASKLVIAFAAQDAAAKLRLRSCVVLGIYSNNPIVGKMKTSPIITESMLEGLFMYYANTPAATENGLHEVKKSLSSMTKKTGSVVKALLEYDSQIAAALAAAGQPEAALAVKALGTANRTYNNSRRAAQPAPPKLPRAPPKASSNNKRRPPKKR